MVRVDLCSLILIERDKIEIQLCQEKKECKQCINSPGDARSKNVLVVFIILSWNIYIFNEPKFVYGEGVENWEVCWIERSGICICICKM